LVTHATGEEPSPRALESRLDELEREYERRLRRLEDRRATQVASDGTAEYAVMPDDDVGGPPSNDDLTAMPNVDEDADLRRNDDPGREIDW
jgi:hypothetical protein